MRYQIKVTSAVLGLLTFITAFFCLSILGQARVTVDYKDYYQVTYSQGLKSNIIHQSNDTFLSECQRELGPGYVNYVRSGGKESFPAFAKANYYGQDDLEETNSHPQKLVFNHSDKNVFAHTTLKHSHGYHMRAGDILVCHGTSIVGAFIGHAGIASSSSHVLEMPGPNRRAHNTSKKVFFKNHAINAYTYVDVYRLGKKSVAKKAAKYAYSHMYKHHNPRYVISTNLYHKNPSYCSKYVYLAYYWGATKKCLRHYKNGVHVVTPYGLVGNFTKHYRPYFIEEIIGK